MAKYTVEADALIAHRLEIEVEANSPSEAIEKALNHIEKADVEDWELVDGYEFTSRIIYSLSDEENNSVVNRDFEQYKWEMDIQGLEEVPPQTLNDRIFAMQAAKSKEKIDQAIKTQEKPKTKTDSGKI